jgi:hypothetical protein
MYGQYVGKDDAMYWAAWRYLGGEGLVLPLEIDESIVAEIKALELSTRPDLREEEASWYEASRLPVSSDFTDVMAEIGRRMPPA